MRTLRNTCRKLTLASELWSSVLAAAVLLLVFAVPSASGQEARLQIKNLEKLADKAAEVVDVTLDGPMLQLAAKFMSDERSPEEGSARELVRKLKGIYVKSFEFDDEGQYSQADVDLIRAQLRSPGWQRIVDVRSKRDHENDEVYLMGAAENIQGMAIISAERRELTVVNIVGPIDVDKLSQLEGNLGIPHLGLERSGKSHKDKGREVGEHDNAK